jgi:ferric-dicitrate binding protein FerR (iron transport regulator)
LEYSSDHAQIVLAAILEQERERERELEQERERELEQELELEQEQELEREQEQERELERERERPRMTIWAWLGIAVGCWLGLLWIVQAVMGYLLQKRLNEIARINGYPAYDHRDRQGEFERLFGKLK